jgi:hypothetical protein
MGPEVTPNRHRLCIAAFEMLLRHTEDGAPNYGAPQNVAAFRRTTLAASPLRRLIGAPEVDLREFDICSYPSSCSKEVIDRDE